MASAAERARVMVSALVSWSRSMTCRKSSTGLLLVLPGASAGAAAAGGGVDEGGVVDLGLQAGAVGLVEDAQVVDAGGLGLGALLAVAGAGLGVPVAADEERDGFPGGLALVPHVDVGQVEGVEDQLDGAADQRGVDLVEVAVQGDSGRLFHRAPLGPQERLVQLRRGRQRQRIGDAGCPAG